MTDRELPPLPRRNRSMFCTKCGYANNETEATANAPCENSNCQYFAFVREYDYTADQMRAYAEAAIKQEREQAQALTNAAEQFVAWHLDNFGPINAASGGMLDYFADIFSDAMRARSPSTPVQGENEG